MKTKVWPLSLRIFHWLLAIGFTTAYLLGENRDLRNIHAAFGILVGSLIFFRLAYGLFGPQYVRFSDFPLGLKHQKAFIKGFLDKAKLYTGHNPLAALGMLSILLVGLLTSAAGFLMWGGKKGLIQTNLDRHMLEEVHEVLANLFLALVVIHLVGLLVDFVLHRRNGTLLSMVTGKKNMEGIDVKEGFFRKVYAVIWIAIPVVLFVLVLKKYAF